MGATLDAATLRRAMSLYLEALEEHREEIDSLNVFPVPDGDTGTNMLLTQRAVAEAAKDLDGASIDATGEAIARAALMGARGNSGVILSQILRGLCDRLRAGGDPGGSDLAEALARADEEARAAVSEPKEGTILSVLHDAALAGESAEKGSVADVAEAAFRAGASSLERTRDQLDELREAGVVDAGGKGLVLLLDAIRAAVEGGVLVTEVGPLGPVGHRAEPADLSSRYGNEVMYLIDAGEEGVPDLRAELARIGDSVVVVGGGGTYHAHVHTDDPDAAVEAGARIGTPREVRVTSLDEQVAEHCIAADGLREVRSDAPRVTEEDGRSLIAVAEGDGMVRLFESLGARVVRGGPGNNPAVGDLVGAIEASPGATVFLLPNHRNVWPAAEAAAREAFKDVEVVHTRSFPQGLVAALEFRPDGDEEDFISMFVSADEAAAGAVARAEREAGTAAGRVRPGDWVGIDFEDGEVHSVGGDAASAAARLAGERLSADHRELVTLFVGADGTPAEAEEIAAAIREALPEIEVEIQRGDQPRYPYLIGVE